MYHGHGVEEHQRAARRRHLHHALPWVRQRLDAAERSALRGARQLRTQRQGERRRRHSYIGAVVVIVVGGGVYGGAGVGVGVGVALPFALAMALAAAAAARRQPRR